MIKQPLLIVRENAGRSQFEKPSKPRPLPEVESAAMHAWREGWWQGIAIGFVLGAATVVAMLK